MEKENIIQETPTNEPIKVNVVEESSTPISHFEVEQKEFNTTTKKIIESLENRIKELENTKSIQQQEDKGWDF